MVPSWIVAGTLTDENGGRLVRLRVVGPETLGELNQEISQWVARNGGEQLYPDEITVAPALEAYEEDRRAWLRRILGTERSKP